MAKLVVEGDRDQPREYQSELDTQRDHLAKVEAVLASGKSTKKVGAWQKRRRPENHILNICD